MPTAKRKTAVANKGVFLIIDQDGDTRRFDTPANKVGPTKEFVSQANALAVAEANVGKEGVDFLYVVKATHKVVAKPIPVKAQMKAHTTSL